MVGRRNATSYNGDGETLKNLKDEKDGVYENYLYFFQTNGFYKN